MLRIKWLALTTAVLGGFVVFLAFARAQDRSATLIWDYDYSKDQPCGAVVGGKRLETKCVVGFNAFIREADTRVEEQFLPNRLEQDGQAVGKAISVKVPVRRYGHLEFCVTAVGKEENGRLVESHLTCTKRWVLPFLKQ